MTTDELKPCPFCGWTPSVREYGSELREWMCDHPDCPLSTLTDHPGNGWPTWETRPIEDELRAEIKRLKKALEGVDTNT